MKRHGTAGTPVVPFCYIGTELHENKRRFPVKGVRKITAEEKRLWDMKNATSSGYGGNAIDFPYRRIASLKTDILIRESFLLELNFPLFYGKI